MLDVETYYVARGPSFSPRAAAVEQGVEYEDAHDPGDPGTRRPEPHSDGYARWMLEAPGTSILDSDYPWDAAERAVALCRRHGADQIVIYVTIGYTAQCNFEFSPQTMARVAQLGATLAVSCYESDRPE